MKNIKGILKDVWNWLVQSSADPRKIALTVKGGISTIVLVLGYLGIAGEGLNVDQLGDSVGELIVQGVTGVTALVTAWGIARKIYITVSAALRKPA